MSFATDSHFDEAQSIHRLIARFCVCDDGYVQQDRMIRMYAGAIAECLLDYEDWKDGLTSFFGFDRALDVAMDTSQWHEGGYATRSFALDNDAELGRSVIRSHLDDTPESSYLLLKTIRESLLSVLPADDSFWIAIHDIATVILVSEQTVHTLCDQIIDICMGEEGWSLGDCVQALAALSGEYHAKSLQLQNLGQSTDAVIHHDFDHMIQTMMSEALRLGMPDHAGLYTMIAANDMRPYVPFRKAEDIDVIAVPLFRVFHVMDSDLRSMMLSKTTGRMMAVAAAGDQADMDCCVVTPLALSSMQGSYNHCLQASVYA